MPPPPNQSLIQAHPYKLAVDYFGDFPVALRRQVNAVAREEPLQLMPWQLAELVMEVDEWRVFLGRHVSHGLDVPSMQRHQIVEIIQPMQGQVGRFPSAPMRSGGGEQDGDDVMIACDADHAAEVGAEVGQGDAIRAGLPEEPHQGKHGPVGELDDPQIRRLPEEARRVLVLETDALPMVVPSEVHGDGLRLHGQDVPLQLLQAGPGAPAFDADGHEREDGVRIARLDDRSQFAGVASALAARVAHEDYRRTPICSGGHSVGVSVWNPEQIGVDKKPRSKMDRSGIAELDPGRR